MHKTVWTLPLPSFRSSTQPFCVCISLCARAEAIIRHLRYGDNRNRKFKTQIHSHPTLPLHHRNYRRHPPNKQIGPRKSFPPLQHVIPRQRMTTAPTDLVPILLATLLHRWRPSNAPLVTYASVLLQVAEEVGVDVNTVVMGRPRISQSAHNGLLSRRV